MVDSRCEVDLPAISTCPFCTERERSSQARNRRGYLWRLEGVVCWEMDCEEEDSTGVWTITLFERISKRGVGQNKGGFRKGKSVEALLFEGGWADVPVP